MPIYKKRKTKQDGIMTKQKVYATRARVPEAIELLQALFEVEVWPETTPPPKEVVLDQACLLYTSPSPRD